MVVRLDRICVKFKGQCVMLKFTVIWWKFFLTLRGDVYILNHQGASQNVYTTLT